MKKNWCQMAGIEQPKAQAYSSDERNTRRIFGYTHIAPSTFACAGRSRKSTQAGHCITNSGADTVCVGNGCHILSWTGRIVTLKRFDDGKTLRKEVKVVTAATVWEDNAVLCSF